MVAAMVEQPSGTVTLVFTDIEGSTRLLQELGQDAYLEVLAEHRRIVRDAFGRHCGYEVDYEGDSFFYTFGSASDAVAAVTDAMRGLESGPIRLRVGVHTGEPGLDPPKYFGMDVHFAARVMAAGHGGQVLLTRATSELLELELKDLGEHRLRDFAESVWLFQLGEREFPPLRTVSNTNLPRPASSFVGRQRELAELTALLSDGARLVTLTGPGGSGKTRLAIEAAAELVPDFKAGVFWVGLAALREPAFVMETIRRTLGVKGGVAEHIGERELLLLLDNLEQVIASAPVLAALVETCPHLRLLVTSRELLRVRGEREYPVSPFDERDAVELFCARAHVEPDENVRALCRALDFLPLALELAAARANVLSSEQILERLTGRLDLLKGGRDADPRQQTLRATVGWSYELLADDERRLFQRLAVFAGGCTLEAAAEVADAELDTLQSLVEKNLLRHSVGRFGMLETIREYALERLEESAEAERLRQAHANFFLALAEGAESELDGEKQRDWLARLEDEHGNLRAALAYSIEEEVGLRLASALEQFWDVRGYFAEGRQSLAAALERASREPTPLLARALRGAAHLALREGDHRQARAWSEQRLAIARALADSELVASALHGLANVDNAEEEYEHATSRYKQALRLFDELSDGTGVRGVTLMLGVVELNRGDFERATGLLEKAVALSREALDEWRLALALATLAHVALEQGRLAQAREHMHEALQILVDLDAKPFIGVLLAFAAALEEGGSAWAGRLLGAAAALQEDYSPELSAFRRVHERTLAAVHERLGPDAFESFWAEGAAMRLEDVVAHALKGPLRTGARTA